MLPTILLSGFIFPIENMPKIYDYVSMIMPPRYFIVIIKNIMIKGNRISLYLERDAYTDNYDNGIYRTKCKEF